MYKNSKRVWIMHNRCEDFLCAPSMHRSILFSPTTQLILGKKQKEKYNPKHSGSYKLRFFFIWSMCDTDLTEEEPVT